MKKRASPFSEIYQIDQATNLYMIEVALDGYADIFNEWDSTPFKRRDIDPDLVLYLEESSHEIPFRYPIEIYFTLPPKTRNESMEEESKQGIANSFSFKMHLLRKELKRTNARTLLFILIGFIFLWIATLVSKHFADQELLSLLSQGLFIGGWVFLWEAVSLFFFTKRDLYTRHRTYKRLQEAPIVFQAAPSLESLT